MLAQPVGASRELGMAVALGKALVSQLVGLDEGAEFVDGCFQHAWRLFAGDPQVT